MAILTKIVFGAVTCLLLRWLVLDTKTRLSVFTTSLVVSQSNQPFLHCIRGVDLVNWEPMDLRNRTLPEQPTNKREPSVDSESGEHQQLSIDVNRSSPTLILDDDGFTLPFDMERTTKHHGEPLPSTSVGDKETPMVRWPMPPRIRGEPPKDFEGDMREFMEGERYSPCAGNPMERPREREDTSDTLLAKRPIERPQFVTPIVREEQARTVHPDLGYKAAGGGAAGGSIPHYGQSRSGDHADDRRNARSHGVEYERLLPPGSRYRGRASAHRPAEYYPETPRFDRIPEFLFSEPRPYFPTFSGRHDEWEAFWLKFQLMARRYNWSEEKQTEQLLFCLKEEALSFAANLGPEIRDNIFVFSQSLRDRFSHRAPAETVRASLNNIKKNSKESIQEYASRVRAMMAKAYPDIGLSDTFNQLTIHHLLQGLPDQSIAYEVLIRKPRTLSEAVDMITWHECCKETTRKKSAIRHLSTFEEQDEPVVDGDLQTLKVRRVNGKRFVTEERLIQFGRELKTSIEKLFREDKEGTTNKAEENMPRRPGGKGIICYFCHEPGHVASRCPVRIQERIQEKQQKQNSTEQKQPENGNGLSQTAGAQTQ